MSNGSVCLVIRPTLMYGLFLLHSSCGCRSSRLRCKEGWDKVKTSKTIIISITRIRNFRSCRHQSKKPDGSISSISKRKNCFHNIELFMCVQTLGNVVRVALEVPPQVLPRLPRYPPRYTRTPRRPPREPPKGSPGRFPRRAHPPGHRVMDK